MGVLNNIFKGAKKYPVVTGIVIFICIVLIATIIFIGLAMLIGAIYALILSRKGKVTQEYESNVIDDIIKELKNPKVTEKLPELLNQLNTSIKKIYPYSKQYSFMYRINPKDEKYKKFMKNNVEKYENYEPIDEDEIEQAYLGLAYNISKSLFSLMGIILKMINKKNLTNRSDFTISVNTLFEIKEALYTSNKYNIPTKPLYDEFSTFYSIYDTIKDAYLVRDYADEYVHKRESLETIKEKLKNDLNKLKDLDNRKEELFPSITVEEESEGELEKEFEEELEEVVNKGPKKRKTRLVKKKK